MGIWESLLRFWVPYNSNDPDLLRFNCWVIGTSPDRISPVYISRDATIGDLKIAIKKAKSPIYDDQVADTFDLWEVSIHDSKLEAELLKIRSLEEYGPKLRPLKSITSLANVPNHLHIVVRIPDALKLPCIPVSWSLRNTTVVSLFEQVQRCKFIHIRGTPGCGKTTLLRLLEAHIKREQPSSYVHVIQSWDRNETRAILTEYLKERIPHYPSPPAITYLLFDDAQDTYSDFMLWNSLFKDIENTDYFIVLFSSYGSPTGRQVIIQLQDSLQDKTRRVKGTPVVIREAARVSLHPKDDRIGLLLTREEFQEVVERYEDGLLLDDELKSLIFRWTGGHAGAVSEILHIISQQRRKEKRKDTILTVSQFREDHPLPSMVEDLNGGPFARGLPYNADLKNPGVAAVFRDLLKLGFIELSDGHKNESVILCHRNGWLHSETTCTNYDTVIRYTFSSFLHEACVSWKLEPLDHRPPFPTILDMVFNVISRFKPSNLRLLYPRMHGSPTENPHEAIYAQEFYRSLHDLTRGSVRITPDFASASGAPVLGRIDFFVPQSSWGIEILRDGSDLSGHNARFQPDGAYGAWLESREMVDYVLLDFRRTVPRDPHPFIRNLYHIVFNDAFNSFTLYNNKVELLYENIVLLENH